MALSYSGRADLAAAAAQLAAEAAAGRLAPEAITPELLGRRLATRGLPPAWREPDLLIRTSGEQRLSNFLCWEAAYAGGGAGCGLAGGAGLRGRNVWQWAGEGRGCLPRGAASSTACLLPPLALPALLLRHAHTTP